MKIKNPARHLPHYAIRVYFPDGTQMNKRGSAQPEIGIPVEEGEYTALILEGLNSARVSQVKLLLIDGKWVDFSEEVLAAMLAPKPTSKPKCKCKRPKPKSKPVVRKLPKPGEAFDDLSDSEKAAVLVVDQLKVKGEARVNVNKDSDKE